MWTFYTTAVWDLMHPLILQMWDCFLLLHGQLTMMIYNDTHLVKRACAKQWTQATDSGYGSIMAPQTYGAVCSTLQLWHIKQRNYYCVHRYTPVGLCWSVGGVREWRGIGRLVRWVGSILWGSRIYAWVDFENVFIRYFSVNQGRELINCQPSIAIETAFYGTPSHYTDIEYVWT